MNICVRACVCACLCLHLYACLCRCACLCVQACVHSHLESGEMEQEELVSIAWIDWIGSLVPHRTAAIRLPLQPRAGSSRAVMGLLVRPAASTHNPSSVASFRADWKVFLIDLELKSKKTKVSFLLAPTAFSYRDSFLPE